jgi:hypothetical protein
MNPMRSVVPTQTISKPFSICCVVGSMDDAHDLEEVVVVRSFCAENGVRFQCREFDSARYEDDAIAIQTLPAFHLYDKRRSRQSTFYVQDDPLRRIREEILRCKAAEEAAAAAAEARKAQWRTFMGLFRGRGTKIAASR